MPEFVVVLEIIIEAENQEEAQAHGGKLMDTITDEHVNGGFEFFREIKIETVEELA